MQLSALLSAQPEADDEDLGFSFSKTVKSREVRPGGTMASEPELTHRCVFCSFSAPHLPTLDSQQ